MEIDLRLKQGLVGGCGRFGNPEMRIRPRGGASPSWRALNQALLEQIRFVNVFNCAGIFSGAGGQGFEPDRTALVFFDHRFEQGAINPVEAEMIHFERVEGLVGYGF